VPDKGTKPLENLSHMGMESNPERVGNQQAISTYRQTELTRYGIEVNRKNNILNEIPR